MRDSRLEGVLTRYSSFSRYVSFLEKGLFLAKATSFEDPWEGHVFHSITAEQENIKNLAAFVNNRKQHVYVNCWHASAHESYAMWRIYGKEDAVAIHTDIEKLKSVLKDIYEFHKAKPILLTPVEYTALVNGELPELDDDKIYYISYGDSSSERDTLWRNAMVSLLRFKPNAYKYEQEVRLIAVDSDAPDFIGDITKENNKKGLMIPINLKEFITGVTVAPWADSAFIGAVKATSEKFGLSADLVQKSTLFDHPGADIG